MAQLEREFDRFGAIKKIDWVKNEPTCYITFETVDAAQAAVKEMRGYPLGGQDRRLRTDFADAGGFPPPKKYADGGDYEYGSTRGPGSETGSQPGAADFDFARAGYRQASSGPGSTGQRSYSRRGNGIGLRLALVIHYTHASFSNLFYPDIK